MSAVLSATGGAINPFDDEWYEPPSVDLPAGVVYCTSCGTIYIFEQTRECPTCALAEAIDELRGDEGER